MLDGLRLAVGTLTAIPVKPPQQVDRATARWAMLLAPVAVLPLGVLAGLAVWVLGHAGVSSFAVGVVVVGVLALGSRAFHLDGLSDVADGLTASYDRERSLAVMKSGTSGPAGTVALIVVLGAQVSAFGWPGITDGPHPELTVGALVCLSRCALWLTCVRGVASARTDGLGSPFAGSVPRAFTVVGWVAALAVLALLREPGGRGVLTGLVALGLVGLLLHRVVRRFGGVTGDVYGAAIELTLAVLLVGMSGGNSIFLAG